MGVFGAMNKRAGDINYIEDRAAIAALATAWGNLKYDVERLRNSGVLLTRQGMVMTAVRLATTRDQRAEYADHAACYCRYCQQVRSDVRYQFRQIVATW